ncbi:unnamed protein product [Gadus morhua 'NCC']
MGDLVCLFDLVCILLSQHHRLKVSSETPSLSLRPPWCPTVDPSPPLLTSSLLLSSSSVSAVVSLALNTSSLTRILNILFLHTKSFWQLANKVVGRISVL